MNILYINHYAGSLRYGMEFRPYYLAREWQKQGHTVRIIAGDFSHLRNENPIVEKDLQKEIVEGIEYQWLKTGAYQGNGVKRMLSMFRFIRKLRKNAKRIIKDFHPDVVIASSTYPLDTYPARRIAKKAKAVLVHEVHDMWPITPIELYGMSRLHPFVIVMGKAEKAFCKHADLVVSVLPKAEDYLIEHGMKKEKFVYVGNGINLADWESPEPLPDTHSSVIERAHAQGRTVIGFFGSHTRSYCLDTMLYAMAKCDQSRFLVLFVGGGIEKENLIRLAESLQLDKDCYAFLPSIPKGAIPSLLTGIDASYVGALRNKMFRFGIGMNKLFDAMMGAKPILYAVEAPNNLIEEYKCGISVEAENVDALAQGITELLALSEQQRLEMGNNGKEAVLAHFNYDVLSRKMAQAMQDKMKRD